MNEKVISLGLESVSQKKLFYRFVKRMFDIILSFVALFFLWPILAVIAIIVKLDSKGPAILKQERIGKSGKSITIYKFRTMVENADEILFKLLEINEDMAREYKVNKKLENDPRITRVGKILRKLSIDELPQLINIFLGEMTIVGPRPYLHREISDMGSYYDQIIKMTPGLTGYWQVNGRSDTTFNERLMLDQEYYYLRGLKEDIKIFFETFKVVFKKSGAK